MHVVRIVEFVGLDVLVAMPSSRDEILGIALVRFGKRGGIGGDGERMLAERSWAAHAR